MHTGSPFWFRRHSVVVVVLQLAQDVPARRAADCSDCWDSTENTQISHLGTASTLRKREGFFRTDVFKKKNGMVSKFVG